MMLLLSLDIIDDLVFVMNTVGESGIPCAFLCRIPIGTPNRTSCCHLDTASMAYTVLCISHPCRCVIPIFYHFKGYSFYVFSGAFPTMMVLRSFFNPISSPLLFFRAWPRLNTTFRTSIADNVTCAIYCITKTLR